MNAMIARRTLLDAMLEEVNNYAGQHSEEK